MDLKEEYKREKGKWASVICTDAEGNSYFTEDYVEWLEERVVKNCSIPDISRSFSKVVIKNKDGILKTLNDTKIIPRTNNLLYINGKRYQVSSNVFNYDEKTIYVWVGVLP